MLSLLLPLNLVCEAKISDVYKRQDLSRDAAGNPVRKRAGNPHPADGAGPAGGTGPVAVTLGSVFDGIGGFPLAAVRSASDSARYKALGNSAYLIMVVMRRTDVKTAPGEDSWRSCFT